jgi:hypothetical protein
VNAATSAGCEFHAARDLAAIETRLRGDGEDEIHENESERERRQATPQTWPDNRGYGRKREEKRRQCRKVTDRRPTVNVSVGARKPVLKAC